MGAFTTPFRPSDIPTGLVGYWKFNNDATDSSVSGNNLTASGSPTYTANGNYWKDEYCAVTNGSSQRFYAGDIYDMNGKSFTVSVWVKPDTVSGAQYICTKGSPTNDGWTFGFSNTDVGVYYHTDSTSFMYTGAVAGKWQHITFTFNYATSVGCIYMDGNLVKTATTTAVLTNVAKNFAVASRDPDGDVQNFDGSIKDLAIWEACLTPLQVKSLALGVDLSAYAYRPNNVSTQPTHWWKLNEISGNRADSGSGAWELTDNSTVPSAGGYVEAVGASFAGSAGEYLSHTHTSSTGVDFGTGDWSISWVQKFTSVADANRWQLSCFDGSSAGWGIMINPATPNFVLYDSGVHSLSVTPNAIAINTPYHFTIKRTGNDLKFYQDGVQVGATKDATGITYNGTTNYVFEVGATQTGNGVNYGVMSDVAIWKGYALSDAEIKSLACALPIQRQGFINYWKLNETSGNRVDTFGSGDLVQTGTVGYTSGVVGNGVDFASTNSNYLTAPDSSAYDFGTDEFCFSSWVNLGTLGGGQVMVGALDVYTSGVVQTILSSAYYVYVVGTARSFAFTFTTGVNYHLTFQRRGGYVQAFVNGVPSSTADIADTGNITGLSNGFRIGYDFNALWTNIDGMQDEYLIGKRGLRPEEIKAVYLKGLNGKEATSSEIPDTLIKTINGLAKASVKVINGLAIASAKTWNGLA